MSKYYETIEGKRCCCYHKDRFWIWIADSGDKAFIYGAGGYVKGKCKMLKDCMGPFVMDWTHTKIYIENAVMACFCPPYPKDGKDYMIDHKDDNWENCDYRNLKWAPYHYRNSKKKKEDIYLDGDKYEVFSNGTIKWGGEFEIISDYWFDDDVDLYHITADPFIIIGDERVKVYKIMRACGFIQGDDANLKKPAILHRDEDYLNFASDNLEWVEEDDPRYVEYITKRQQAMEAREKEMNGNKPRPQGWI